jgi:hypothetical protein
MATDQKVYLVDFGAVQDKASAEGKTFTVVGPMATRRSSSLVVALFRLLIYMLWGQL